MTPYLPWMHARTNKCNSCGLLLARTALLLSLAPGTAAGATSAVDVAERLAPAQAVRVVADHILNDTADAHEFQTWGYGQSIMLDAMMLAAETVCPPEPQGPGYLEWELSRNPGWHTSELYTSTRVLEYYLVT